MKDSLLLTQIIVCCLGLFVSLMAHFLLPAILFATAIILTVLHFVFEEGGKE
jgi:hypothetical protein